MSTRYLTNRVPGGYRVTHLKDPKLSFVVTRPNGRMTCTCPDFKLAPKGACEHILEVVEFHQRAKAPAENGQQPPAPPNAPQLTAAPGPDRAGAQPAGRPAKAQAEVGPGPARAVPEPSESPARVSGEAEAPAERRQSRQALPQIPPAKVQAEAEAPASKAVEPTPEPLAKAQAEAEAPAGKAAETGSEPRRSQTEAQADRSARQPERLARLRPEPAMPPDAVTQPAERPGRARAQRDSLASSLAAQQAPQPAWIPNVALPILAQSETARLLELPFRLDQIKLKDDVPYVDGASVIQRLNDVLGTARWSFRLLGGPLEVRDEIVVRGRLTAWIEDKRVVKEDYGAHRQARKRADQSPVSYGDTVKSAVTDCIKRCAHQLGVGLHLYSKDGSYQSFRHTRANAARQTEAAEAETEAI